MTLTSVQTLVIVLMVTLATVITRFLPFILFKANNSKNSYISYLGQVLPYAVIGLLVVYCLKNVSFSSPTFAIPEIIAIVSIIALHYWKENTLLSIGFGTAIYMILVQFVFV
jgi:branched-subunit amino acid transport protein AzlD